MTTKTIALLTSVSAAVLYVLSFYLPNDPYFYLISSGAFIGICRLLAAVAMLNLAYQSRFVYKGAHWLAGISGSLLVGFGIAGLAIPTVDYSLYSYVRPLDFLYFAGIGTMLVTASVSYSRGVRPLPRLSRPRPNQFRLLNRTPA